jgi:hypothetical protein
VEQALVDVIVGMLEKTLVGGAFLFLLYMFVTKFSVTLDNVSKTLIKISKAMESMDKRMAVFEERLKLLEERKHE